MIKLFDLKLCCLTNLSKLKKGSQIDQDLVDAIFVRSFTCF